MSTLHALQWLLLIMKRVYLALRFVNLELPANDLGKRNVTQKSTRPNSRNSEIITKCCRWITAKSDERV